MVRPYKLFFCVNVKRALSEILKAVFSSSTPVRKLSKIALISTTIDFRMQFAYKNSVTASCLLLAFIQMLTSMYCLSTHTSINLQFINCKVGECFKFLLGCR